jgi:ATP-binding cassette subfamily B protein/subfamily B ATP-binding cassette protein MsbA
VGTWSTFDFFILLASPNIPFRQLISLIVNPFRDQQPASRLIRETARKEGSLIVTNFICSLVQAGSEGLTLGVMFLAVEVLSTPATQAVQLTKLPVLGSIPYLNSLFSDIPRFQAFSLLLTIAVVLKLAQGLAQYIGTVSLGYFGNRVSRRITSSLHSQILEFSYSCASRYRVGELQFFNSAGPQAIISAVNCYNQLFITFLLLSTYLVVLISLSPWLLIAAILLGCISTLLQRSLLPRVGRRAQVSTTLGKELSSRMTENIQALRLLHTSGFLSEAAHEVEKQTYVLEHNSRGQTRLMAVNTPVSIVLPIIMIAIIAWLSILFLGQRNSGILPSLVTFVVALQRLNGSIGAISETVLRFQSNSANLEMLNSFLDQKDKEYRRKSGMPYQGFTHEIRLNEITLKYAKELTPALNEISIVLPRGETIALVGRSGAGKSSIADILAGLYDPTHGSVTVDGVDLRSYELSSWQKRIGVVSQDTFLFNASIAANIAFGTPSASMEAIQKAAQEAQAAGFIEQLPNGYETLVGERGYRLSGGQRQRISLARAILRDPDLLILDEATSALDTESERLVQEAIDKFDRKHTILVIAHRLSTIVNADNIYVLEQGQVIEAGNHSQLIKKEGIYFSLWQQQIKTTKNPSMLFTG